MQGIGAGRAANVKNCELCARKIAEVAKTPKIVVREGSRHAHRSGARGSKPPRRMRGLDTQIPSHMSVRGDVLIVCGLCCVGGEVDGACADCRGREARAGHQRQGRQVPGTATTTHHHTHSVGNETLNATVREVDRKKERGLSLLCRSEWTAVSDVHVVHLNRTFGRPSTAGCSSD